jgi:hypothetical protein
MFDKFVKIHRVHDKFLVAPPGRPQMTKGLPSIYSGWRPTRKFPQGHFPVISL